MPPNEGGATPTPPNNRGKKEKRGDEGCNGVAMDTIDNQTMPTQMPDYDKDVGRWQRQINNQI